MIAASKRKPDRVLKVNYIYKFRRKLWNTIETENKNVKTKL